MSPDQPGPVNERISGVPPDFRSDVPQTWCTLGRQGGRGNGFGSNEAVGVTLRLIASPIAPSSTRR
jgi:hypothetical protein